MPPSSSLKSKWWYAHGLQQPLASTCVRSREMAEDKSRDLHDIMAEETSRGRKQPKKTLTLEQERMIRNVAAILVNPKCDRLTYIDAIREYGLKEESAEYRQLLALWRKLRGNGW